MKKGLIAALLLLALALPGCGKKTFPPESDKPLPSAAAYAEGKELFATFETEEDAQAVAELYGIELVSFSDGVAVFHTEEDPAAVVARGKEKGWAPIEINYLRQPFSN